MKVRLMSLSLRLRTHVDLYICVAGMEIDARRTRYSPYDAPDRCSEIIERGGPAGALRDDEKSPPEIF